MATSKSKKGDAIPEGSAVIAGVLKAAGARPKPKDTAPKKNQYAIRFADAMAKEIASHLRPKLRDIEATGKRLGGSVAGSKQLDINFSTVQFGLVLGISLKSVHIREDTGAQRYTHNMKRNEEELRIEASGYHKRQPYAVMCGVLFLPYDSCQDGRGSGENASSSFGSWVRKLRPFAGRSGPTDDIDRFEKIYIALYEPDGSELRFFDVESDPPKNKRPPSEGELLAEDGRPRRVLTYAEFLDATYHQYLQRNHVEFKWADGEEEPLGVNDVAPPAGNARS